MPKKRKKQLHEAIVQSVREGLQFVELSLSGGVGDDVGEREPKIDQLGYDDNLCNRIAHTVVRSCQMVECPYKAGEKCKYCKLQRRRTNDSATEREYGST